MWWSRALDARPDAKRKADRRSDWQRAVSTLRAELLGTEQARVAVEARYLDGHDCLFPELADAWRELCAAAEMLMDDEARPDEELCRGQAGQRLQRVVLMARADGLEASGRWAEADAIARRVLSSAHDIASEGGHG
jgi:hypothetical protein